MNDLTDECPGCLNEIPDGIFNCPHCNYDLILGVPGQRIIINKTGVDFKDKNDCTIRAFSIAANVPYEQVSAIATRLGRRRNGLFDFGKLVKYHGIPGLRFEYHQTRKGLTVHQLLGVLKEGIFVVRVYKHLFAYINGVIHDSYAARKKKSRVTHLWQVHRPKIIQPLGGRTI